MTSNNLNGESTHLIKSIALSTIEDAGFVPLLTSMTIAELVAFLTGAFFATGFLMVGFGAGFLTGVFLTIGLVTGFLVAIFVIFRYIIKS
jgi:hypothetical protein